MLCAVCWRWMMAQRRPIAWGPIIGGLCVGAAGAGVVAWQFNLQAIEQQIHDTRTGLKKLVLSGGIPPNQEVMDYFLTRGAAVDQQYQQWLEYTTVPPLGDEVSANPQLYFQEQLHEVQRTLERVAAARAIPVPEQLGFPKELPPSETVPRLLVQLALVKEATTLILEQGVTVLTSLKIEDPEPVPEDQGVGTFLMRLPVRVRLTGSLAQLMKILGAFERTKPLIDVRMIRLVEAALTDQLDAELLLARYLLIATALEPTTAEGAKRSSAPKKSTSRTTSSATREAEVSPQVPQRSPE